MHASPGVISGNEDGSDGVDGRRDDEDTCSGLGTASAHKDASKVTKGAVGMIGSVYSGLGTLV